ncbi:MAG TPA: L,D-transpeptidase [Thermomicrobiales bacterium]|nr:L,D-transpeptidase [Thermomicrobiales bacterium]
MPGQRGWFARLARVGAVVALCGSLALLVLPRLGAAAPWAPPTSVFFPQTGHSLGGEFLSYWRSHGRETALGSPVTEQLSENGAAVQYFEYARVEYHPGQTGDAAFSLNRLGADDLAARGIDLTRVGQGYGPGSGPILDAFARLPFAIFSDGTDKHRFFPETGHTLSYAFLLFWQNEGGLAQFGYPITEEFPEISPIDGQVYTTQYFERARFEYHPGMAANYSVVLTPLGLTAAQQARVSTAAVARPSGVSDYSETLFSPPPTPTPTAVTVANGRSARPSSIPAGVKWFDIDLSQQYLTAYSGDTVFWQGYITSGRKGHETPTGTYSIFEKLTSQDMTGPDPSLPNGEYFQPDVPWVMYFADGGYAIHGNYWVSDFGAPSSHGCIGVPVGAAAQLYQWAPMGTLVYVHY